MRSTLLSLLLLILTFTSTFAQSSRRNLAVVYIGNSITYGAMHQDPTKTAPPVICSQWLADQPGIDNCWFVNMGKSGKTTFNFVPAKTDVKNYWKELTDRTAQLVAQHPEAQLVFSIMLGTNDTAERPSNSRTTPYMFHHNLALIIDSLQARYPDAQFVLHKPIYFSVPFTTRNGSYLSTDAPRLLSQYFHEIESLAKEKANVHPGDTAAFRYFRKTYHENLVHEHGYQDCDFWLHPNETGSAILAEYWGRAILQAVSK